MDYMRANISEPHTDKGDGDGGGGWLAAHMEVDSEHQSHISAHP